MKIDAVHMIYSHPKKGTKSVTVKVPHYKKDEWIKKQFPCLLMVKYDERYCSFERSEVTETAR